MRAVACGLQGLSPGCEQVLRAQCQLDNERWIDCTQVEHLNTRSRMIVVFGYKNDFLRRMA